MTLFAASPLPQDAAQLALASVVAALGFFLLLPKPRTRSVDGWHRRPHRRRHDPRCVGPTSRSANRDRNWVGKLLFILFSTGAVGFRHRARRAGGTRPAGAIAFAFVILSTCGPVPPARPPPFLVAATVIIYAGAHRRDVPVRADAFLRGRPHPTRTTGSREPLLGALAGFRGSSGSSCSPSTRARDDPGATPGSRPPALTDRRARENWPAVLAEIERGRGRPARRPRPPGGRP